MKRKQYTLTITEPCNRDWSAMKATGAGKYCDQCKKAVIDLTGLSDVENPPVTSRFNRFFAALFFLGVAESPAVAGNPSSPAYAQMHVTPLQMGSHEATIDAPPGDLLSGDSAGNLLTGRILEARTKLPVPGAIVN
ncbi:hypothetical protein [Flavihumibacter petaseus]|uniref:Uncharacterized protein n=1 Tax=Flavihumibacter petaseus NBRC 106054 TaxID=1220578 RepID=A0A0E9MVG7_9BACT|nr:hypothetical protein [Flavihumibacter petaseus]GAO41406.1 hypothetical protein FPE01S_01_04180 [Flavihumibacter petaseus NBRC 106054]